MVDFGAAIQAEKNSGAYLPKTIQMDWCICSIRDNFKAEKVSTKFIDTGEKLNAETIKETGVTQEHIQKEGVKFKEAVAKVSEVFRMRRYAACLFC